MAFSSVPPCSSTSCTTATFPQWLSRFSRGAVMPRPDYDVIIAGAGIAGVAAAAALKEFGWSILVVEPGQHDDRRLGGELIHPAGVSALKELGLFDNDAFRDAVPIGGFVALPG